MYVHVGLGAFWYGFVVSCARAATARGLTLGREWAPLAAPTRAFAEQVGARWWLDALTKAGYEESWASVTREALSPDPVENLDHWMLSTRVVRSATRRPLSRGASTENDPRQRHVDGNSSSRRDASPKPR